LIAADSVAVSYIGVAPLSVDRSPQCWYEIGMGDDPTKELPKAQDERLEGLVRRVESLEVAVDQKLKQTTPLSSQLTELREYIATCFTEVIERQARMEERQTRMEEQQARLEERQTRMEEQQARMEERQTRMEERQTRMEAQQTRMDDRQGAIEKEVREIGRTLRRINLDLATALRNQDDLDDRVAALETQPS
jgi:chromosome segregation ATPase